MSGAQGWGDWAPDGRSLAWTDDDGIHAWHVDNTLVQCLLRWPARPPHVRQFSHSPDGRHLLAVLAEDSGLLRAVVLRLGDRAVTDLPLDSIELGVAEWSEAEEVLLAHDAVPSSLGCAEYRSVRTVRLPELAWTQHEVPNRKFGTPTHVGMDFSRQLRGLQRGRPGRLTLRTVDGAERRMDLDLVNSWGQAVAALAVVHSWLDHSYALVGVGEETAAVIRLGSLHFAGPEPAGVELSFSGGRQDWLAPVIRCPRSFECTTPGVVQVALWCRS